MKNLICIMVALLPSLLNAIESIEGLDSELRLNEVQYIGTHNSYHIAMGDAMAILLQAAEYNAGEGWTAERLVYSTDYTHASLSTQLKLGLRQFELDVYADPEGGRFAESNLIRLLDETPWNLPIGKGDTVQLMKPGFKVLHNPEYDPRSTDYLLSDCLEELLQWSNEHPDHLPIIIHIEVKESRPRPLLPEFEAAPVMEFNNQIWLDLENSIRETIPKDKRIEPDMVRGDYSTLRRAVKEQGWPTLEQLKGKFLFFLLNKKPQTVSYMQLDQELHGRLFFTSLNQSASAASWFRVPDPSYPGLPDMVNSGFLVTTMADQHTRQSRENDTRQKQKAFQTGAQFILTDYPVPDRRYSDYQVKFSNNRYVRENPVTSSRSDESAALSGNMNPQLDFGPVCGAVTAESATFSFGMQFYGDIGQVVLRKDKEFNKVILSDEVIAAEDGAGIVKVKATGLEPDTKYFYKVKVNGHSAMQNPQSFRTFPKSEASFKFTFGNSLRLFRMNQNGMLASIKENPLFFLNTGDLHYGDIIGTRVDLFNEAFIRVFNTEAHRRTMAVTPLVYMFDDHDYGPNDSDRTAPGREASLLSYRQVIPHYPLVNKAADESIEQVFTVGRARFIMTDLRSSRSPKTDEDGPQKTMMGAEQLKWFLDELKESSRNYAVVFWVSTVPWIQDITDGADQWGGFSFERRKIADFIAANDIKNLVIIGGDAHSLSADDGTHGDYSTKGNMPLVPELIASPLDNDATSVKGGPFSAGVYRATKGENVYGLVEVVDRGSEIVVRFFGKNNRNETKIQLEHRIPVAGKSN